MFASAIEGYHRRGHIETSDEMPVDLSQAVYGGALAVVLAPSLRWLVDYFGSECCCSIISNCRGVVRLVVTSNKISE